MNNDKINNNNNDLNAKLGEILRMQAQSVDEQAKYVRKIPPLERWQPVGESVIDIEIKDNGEWWHEGTKMTRQSLVDLFASVLWVEQVDGQAIHYLKTPSDKYRITVADAPLFINQVQVVHDDGADWIEFITTNGDVVRLDEAHVPYFAAFGEEERLYVKMRFGLVAKVMANVLFHLVEMGELTQILENNHNKTVLKLISGGKIYQLISQA